VSVQLHAEAPPAAAREPGGSPGVYLSVPFCAQKCTYCNFASDVFPPGLLARYVDALCREISAAGDVCGADTLYLGGGTPSLLDPADLERILRPFDARRWTEATIEASPGTVTAEKARAWKRLGIGRVSLGVQSFNTREIAATGRKHTAETVESELAILRRAGIANVNIDLIAGLAWQTEASWRESLDWIARLGPAHVSVYMLESDDESRLGAEIRRGGGRYGAAHVPDEDQTAEFYLIAVERLRELGLFRYEISNFARPGCEPAHNLKYWNLAPYRGFGVDAHSFDGRRRWANAASAAEYVERSERGEPVRAAEWELDAEALLEEKLITGLRKTAGVELTSAEREARRAAIEELETLGWLEAAGPRLRLTPEGVLLSNEVFERLLRSEDAPALAAES